MKKKIAVIVCSAVLMLSLVISGTIAYLTDNAAATNTFTVGDIDITLTEPHWDPTDGDNVLPGDSMLKDPVLTAVKGDSYIRYKVEFVANDALPMDAARVDAILDCICFDATYNAATETPGTVIIDGAKYDTATRNAFTDINPAFTLDAVNSTTATKYYYSTSIFTEGSKTVLFTNVIIPTDYDRADLAALGEFSIVVTGQAIQSAGFTDAADAFNELAP